MAAVTSPVAGEYAARRRFEVRVFRARWFALPLALALVTALRSDPLWLSLLALGGYLLHNVARSRLILRFAVRVALLTAVGVAGMLVARRQWREHRLAWQALIVPPDAALVEAAPTSPVAPAAVPETTPAIPNPLTPRQRRILRLVEAGMTNEQIARELERGVEMVRTHQRAIRERLGVGDRETAARLARERGWLD